MSDLPSNEAIQKKFAGIISEPLFDIEPAADHSEKAPKRRLPPLVGSARCPVCGRQAVGVYQVGPEDYHVRKHIRRTIRGVSLGECRSTAIDPSAITWKEGVKVWKPSIPSPPNDLTLPE